MYAVIEDSGRQFRVSEGDVVNVDLRELPEGASELQFDRVLLIGAEGDVKVGTPLVSGAKVLAEILETELKGPKTESFFHRRRKGFTKTKGHRQKYCQVRIKQIVA